MGRAGCWGSALRTQPVFTPGRMGQAALPRHNLCNGTLALAKAQPSQALLGWFVSRAPVAWPFTAPPFCMSGSGITAQPSSEMGPPQRSKPCRRVAGAERNCCCIPKHTGHSLAPEALWSLAFSCPCRCRQLFASADTQLHLSLHGSQQTAALQDMGPVGHWWEMPI